MFSSPSLSIIIFHRHCSRFALSVFFLLSLLIVQFPASAQEAASLPVIASEAPPVSSPADGPVTAAPVYPEMEARQPHVSPLRTDLPQNLSPLGMFMGADIVVKVVMVGLAFASLATWTVCLVKALEMVFARRRVRRALDVLGGVQTLEEAVVEMEKMNGCAALMARATAEEVALSEGAVDQAGGKGVKERVASLLRRIDAHAGRRMARGTGILATIGSTAPFVGLFGTVWGIMNSFIGISKAQTTNLAVVAPGIAEALLATAIGLIAAIPAVIIYNAFARSVTGYRRLLGDVAAGLERLVSRDLDYRKAGDVRGETENAPRRPLHAIAE